ncbi:MAG: hypothetical protein A3J28_14625 [Acidobacteria bacterium RIFCSPLOWO2_12_FULL_60_22]|nr:MAG: hypothetical protein A3J28_14625 [Acidobacteria bacterium RIFCSPLOWO2_12_FULL_60_22]
MKSFAKFIGVVLLLALLVAGVYYADLGKRGIQRIVSAVRSGGAHETHGVTAPSASSTGERKILYWYDPMRPSYQSDKPGAAPDSGVPLVPAYADAAPSAVPDRPPEATSYAPVQLSPAQQHLIGVTTGRAEYRALEKIIRAVGRVDVDETRIAHVHIKTSGWAEEVFVDYTFQHVKQGDPLFTIYSPDLVSTQEELLLALKARDYLGSSPFPNVSRGSDSLLEATRRRLSLWDVSPAQIEEIERTGQVQRTLTIYSPITGHVTQRNVFPKTFVTPETELYTIVDHSQVWMYANIYESEIGLVELGQHAIATTEAYPGQVLQGRVSYIWPHLDHETRTLKIRMDFPNADLKLKPEMYTQVELKKPLGRRLVVPDSALVDTGARQLVFVVQAPGSFVPRDVRAGVRADGYIEIQQGLKAGEAVVTSANFLIDSESQLRAALGSMPMGTGVTEMAGRPSAPPSGESPGRAEVQIQFRSEPTPPRAGRNNLFVTVTDTAGKPVPNASVKVVFSMPAMPAMGMAARRSEATLNPAEAGVYRGELALPSPGSWQVTVTVERGGAFLGSQQLTVTAQP